MSKDKNEAIGRIARVLREEDFPMAHLRAIGTIVNLFNWSEQTEREVFEFARRLYENDTRKRAINLLLTLNEGPPNLDPSAREKYQNWFQVRVMTEIINLILELQSMNDDYLNQILEKGL